MNTTQQLQQIRLSQWAVLCKEQVQSGLTVKQWCDQNGYTIHTFYYWKRRLKDSYADSLLPEIVPLSSCLSPAPDGTASVVPMDTSHLCNSFNLHNSCNTNTISVTLEGVQISLDPSASDEMLFRILKAVRHA